MSDKESLETGARIAPVESSHFRAVWVGSIGTLLIGLAGVVVSYVAVRVQSSTAEFQNANARAEIQLKQDDERIQNELEARRFAASIVPFMKCTDDQQRTIALGLLDPRYTKLFAEAISNKCANLTTQARNEIAQIQEQSTVRERVADFLRLVANAREYKNQGFDGPAARLFDKAGSSIPDSYRPQVNNEELVEARRAFGDGNFREAADRFDLAFSAFPPDTQ